MSEIKVNAEMIEAGSFWIADQFLMRKDAGTDSIAKSIFEVMAAKTDATGDSVVQQKDEPAKRFDAGKSRVDLIPAEFILALGDHFGVGAKKYAERNWEKGMSYSRCYASAQRHMLAFWRGEEFDEETGTPHVIAAAWNMCALHFYTVHGVGEDDRQGKAQ